MIDLHTRTVPLQTVQWIGVVRVLRFTEARAMWYGMRSEERTAVALAAPRPVYCMRRGVRVGVRRGLPCREFISLRYV